MSSSNQDSKLEIDESVASALAALLFDVPPMNGLQDDAPPDSAQQDGEECPLDVVIDLRDYESAADRSIPDLFADTEEELIPVLAGATAPTTFDRAETDAADEPAPVIALAPAVQQSRLFPSTKATAKPVSKPLAPLFPTSQRKPQNGNTAGLFGPDPAVLDTPAPVKKPVTMPTERAKPVGVEFVPAVKVGEQRDYRIIVGLAIGAVAAIGALVFFLGGSNDPPVTDADVSLIPATQITNTTPTTVALETTGPTTTAAPTTSASITEPPPTTAAPAAPVVTRPPTTRRPAATRPPATAAPVATLPPTAAPVETLPAIEDLEPPAWVPPATTPPATTPPATTPPATTPPETTPPATTPPTTTPPTTQAAAPAVDGAETGAITP